MKKAKTKTGRVLRAAILIVVAAALLCVAAVLIVNKRVMASAEGRILPEQEAAALDADCILVLGAGVWSGGVPSHMLADRLDEAVRLYELGASGKLLMSGDHGREDYDEVNVMKSYAIDAGVPSEDVFMDHAGFSTYESLYRARDVFKAQRIVIVTQRYHLYRALYVAEKLGLEAYGVASDPREYRGQEFRELREILARCKDWAYTIVQPEPTYLGEAIPVSGSGDLTNDKA
ncbi:MAG: YdcF family protein [Oscillospiraceae bacterium]|nr:YdcF family protein [Oscillospiraceae bacterium]